MQWCWLHVHVHTYMYVPIFVSIHTHITFLYICTTCGDGTRDTERCVYVYGQGWQNKWSGVDMVGIQLPLTTMVSTPYRFGFLEIYRHMWKKSYTIVYVYIYIYTYVYTVYIFFRANVGEIPGSNNTPLLLFLFPNHFYCIQLLYTYRIKPILGYCHWRLLRRLVQNGCS